MRLNQHQILNSLSPGADWFRLVNKSDDAPAEIWIYDDIGFWGTTAAGFINQLSAITSADITVHVASRGGDIYDGIAIYNALRDHPARVVTQVDSMAASIASVIAQAGDHRIMLTGSQMMIHDAAGLAMGDAAEMREFADVLDKQSGIIANIYAERSGTDTDFRALMEAETWMDHTETVAAGLADEVVNPTRSTEEDNEDEAATKAAAHDWTEFLDSTEMENA